MKRKITSWIEIKVNLRWNRATEFFL